MCDLNLLFVHPDLTYLGGAERVLIHMIRALRDFNLSLLANRWNPVEITDRFKVKAEKVNWIQCKSFSQKLHHLGAYQWIRYSNSLNEIVRDISEDYDIIIETQQVYLTPPSKTFLVNYLHYPYLLVPPPEVNRLDIRIYYAILRCLLLKRVKRINLALTNSPFTAELIKNYLGIKPIVVYPPVEVEEFNSTKDWDYREDKVVNIGAFIPFKRQLTLLKIARLLPDIKFVLIGLVVKQHAEYYKKIVKSKPKNVTVMHDISPRELKEELSTSKIYVHLCPEHFGISVIEAVAAGCAPIVYHIGGPIEILADSALSWSNTEELTNHIKRIVNNKELWEKMVKKAKHKASKFKSSIFEQKIREIIARAMG